MGKVDVEEQKVLLYDPLKCTGCLFCQIACAYYHFREFNLEKAHLKIQFDEKTGEFEAIYCQHCDQPLCVAACPKEAAMKDEETGLVKINPMRCIGCKTCTVACPLSVPWFNQDYRVAMKCDFCNGDPQCAKFCSPQAIRIASRKEAWEFNRMRYLEV
ncbi:MAG: 4Fe-4S dicluster domain-containing protein [Candidatus Bathyarchaeia archaeon]|nr:4Fe-4S dicluster domain-containing protein [Candidatus Bathyarchaeota archaeon]